MYTHTKKLFPLRLFLVPMMLYSVPKVKSLAQGFSAGQWSSWNSNPLLPGLALSSPVSWGRPAAVPWPLTQEDQRAFQLRGAETTESQAVAGPGWAGNGSRSKRRMRFAHLPGSRAGVLRRHLEARVHKEGSHLPCRAPLTPSLGLAARSCYS